MITTIKLRNDSNRSYNGIKPGQTINVEDPMFYIANGFTLVDQLPIEEDEGLESKSLKELKDLCQELGIEFPKNAKKTDLIELITNNSVKEDDEEEEESDKDLENELE